MKAYSITVHFKAKDFNEAKAMRMAAQEFLGDATSWLKVKEVTVDLPNEEEG